MFVLAVCAFTVGLKLRGPCVIATQPTESITHDYALLKLTPECSPQGPKTSAANCPKDTRDIVANVLSLVKKHYFEPIDSEKETAMARGAVRNMLNSLSDPDSRFLDPKERKLLDDTTAGKFAGIGAVLALRNEKSNGLNLTRIVVVTPMPGSPAETAGIKPGDAITTIDGKWIVTHDPFHEPEMERMLKAVRNKEIDEFTYQKAYEATLKRLKEGIKIQDALKRLSCDISGEIALRVERQGSPKPIDIKVKFGTTQVDSVLWRMLPKGIAYIRISQFNKRAVQEFSRELDKMRASGAKAIILDLRNNPGGLLDSAIQIAGKFTGGGNIGIIREKKGDRPITVSRSKALDLPLVILVNRGTASVAELVAGTLRARQRALLVGTTTFGDGLVQTPLILPDGSAAVLTTGKMITADNTDFEGKGINPDKQINQGQRGDAQLEAAREILLTKLAILNK